MVPSPRMGAQMCVKHGLLYLFGGTVEDGDKQFTLNDIFSLGKRFSFVFCSIKIVTVKWPTFSDLHKLSEWDELVHDDQARYEWIDSDSDSDMGSDEDGSSGSDDDDGVDEEEEAMDED